VQQLGGRVLRSADQRQGNALVAEFQPDQPARGGFHLLEQRHRTIPCQRNIPPPHLPAVATKRLLLMTRPALPRRRRKNTTPGPRRDRLWRAMPSGQASKVAS